MYFDKQDIFVFVLLALIVVLIILILCTRYTLRRLTKECDEIDKIINSMAPHQDPDPAPPEPITKK